MQKSYVSKPGCIEEVSDRNKIETSPYKISRCDSLNVFCLLDDIYNNPKEDKNNFIIWEYYNPKNINVRYKYNNIVSGKLSDIIINNSNLEYYQAENRISSWERPMRFRERKIIESYLNLKSSIIERMISFYSYYKPKDKTDSYIFYYRTKNKFFYSISDIEKFNHKELLVSNNITAYILSFRMFNCKTYLNNGPKTILDVILDNKQNFGSINYYHWNVPQNNKDYYSLFTKSSDYLWDIARYE